MTQQARPFGELLVVPTTCSSCKETPAPLTFRGDLVLLLLASEPVGVRTEGACSFTRLLNEYMCVAIARDIWEEPRKRHCGSQHSQGRSQGIGRSGRCPEARLQGTGWNMLENQ